MSYQMRVAMAGNEEQAVHRKSKEAREITKIANRPSKRLRDLTSRKAPRLCDQPDQQYKGEDLKRGYR
jgi:hypothetical protein